MTWKRLGGKAMGENNLGDPLRLSSSGKVNPIVEGLDDATLQDFDLVVKALDEEYKWPPEPRPTGSTETG